MNLAPIVLFVYNRPWHTKQTLKALANNYLAKQSILYVFADGAKKTDNSEMRHQISETRKMIRTKKWCKEVYITEHESNLGLASNIITGVTKIIQKHGDVIVLEDDIVTSPAFLKYMNEGLNLYRDDQKVACISGYIYPVKPLPETFFLKGADCWGWATWKRIWDTFEKNGQLLLDQLHQADAVADFDYYNSYPYTQMLKDQVQGKNDSWAVRWYASSYLNNQYCLYPGKSFVKNIGLDGSGVHSVAQKSSTLILNKGIKLSMQPVEEDILFKKKIATYLNDSASRIRTQGSAQKMLSKVYNQVKKIIAPNEQVPQQEYGWSGDYKSWDEAAALCDGYGKPEILEKCKASLLKVKNGEAIYERDSVLFNEIQYNWPLLAALQKIAIENDGSLCVLDFGGSLGTTYYQSRKFLEGCKNLTWCIVEQQNFVECGKQYFQDDQLKFFYSIEECLKENVPNILLLSSVLQYLKTPYEWINKFIKTGFKYIIVDRTAFIEEEKELLTIQRVPETIYCASYPAWFFNKSKLLNSFSNKYTALCSFDSGFTDRIIIAQKFRAYWDGILLKKNS
ncbi:MAG: methyltransferase, TIGR04325 family [Ginsengibacter sp.]